MERQYVEIQKKSFFDFLRFSSYQGFWKNILTQEFFELNIIIMYLKTVYLSLKKYSKVK